MPVVKFKGLATVDDVTTLLPLYFDRAVANLRESSWSPALGWWSGDPPWCTVSQRDV